MKRKSFFRISELKPESKGNTRASLNHQGMPILDSEATPFKQISVQIEILLLRFPLNNHKEEKS